MKLKEWHWEITKKCNLNCIHCITNCGAAQRDELTASEAISSLKIMRGLGCEYIMITGGEPFSRKDIFPILEECSDLGIKTQVLTNGSLISQDIAKRLVNLTESVGISLDGSTSHINDCIRGKSSFQKATQSIKTLSKYGIPICLYFTVSRLNIHDMENTIRYAKSLGVGFVHLSEVNIAGRATNNSHLLQLTKEQKIFLEQFAEDATGDCITREKCTADLSSVYMSSNGTIYACTEVAMNYPESSVGNIRTGQINIDWRGGQKIKCQSDCECCYDILAGNDIVFCLNNENICSLTLKK